MLVETLVPSVLREPLVMLMEEVARSVTEKLSAFATRVSTTALLPDTLTLTPPADTTVSVVSVTSFAAAKAIPKAARKSPTTAVSVMRGMFLLISWLIIWIGSAARDYPVRTLLFTE